MTILSIGSKLDFKSFQIPKSFKKSLELALTANVRSSFGNSLFFSITKTLYFFYEELSRPKIQLNPLQQSKNHI